MDLKHQSFGGNKHLRPQPEILINKELQIFAIITPWGPRSEIKKLQDYLLQSYTNLQSDTEITAFVPKLASLSKKENQLRSLFLSCNQWIYEQQNKSEDYQFAYEMICGICDENQILFGQVGHPFIYLDRDYIPLQSLGHTLDLSGGFSKMDKRLAPLPSQLMGLHPDMHFSIFKFPLQKNDKLLFISRALVPTNILEVPKKDRNLENLSMMLSKNDKDMPFWLGSLDFN